MAGLKSTILLVVVNAAAVTLDTSDHSSVSTTVAVVSGMLWLVYICMVFVDQMISMVTSSIMGGDEDEEKEAYDQRAVQVEMAARAMAAQKKSAEAAKLNEQLTAVIIKRSSSGGMGGG